jgi:hypothetical protein
MTRTLRLTLCAAALLVPTANPVPAQSDPFETAIETALAEAGVAAPILRCTAIFRAFRIYAGEDTDLGATAAEREGTMAAAGVIIWQNDTGTEDLEAAFEAIVPMIGAGTELYLRRMSANQETEGTVFDLDLETDLTYCVTLYQEIESRTAE